MNDAEAPETFGIYPSTFRSHLGTNQGSRDIENNSEDQRSQAVHPNKVSMATDCSHQIKDRNLAQTQEFFQSRLRIVSS